MTKELKAALLEHLTADATTAEDISLGIREIQKVALEALLEAELAEHLGYEKHAAAGYNGKNSRNGKTKKKVTTDTTTLEIEVPRDRDGTFEPVVIEKGQSRLKGFDEKVVSLYARGMTTRDIRGHIEEIYGVDISPDLVSRITDKLLPELKAWQARALEPVYPIVYFDGFVVKIRHNGVVRNRTIYVVLGVNISGHREVLGLWVAASEGAKFWLGIMNDLRSRGVKDILITAVDGLKGFPEALEASFPQSIVQTCVVHMIRSSTNLVAWKTRKEVAADLREIYTAPNEEAAVVALDAFAEKWDVIYPSVSKAWRSNWSRISPFFEFSKEIRKLIYTTNPVESVNRVFRKATKTRGVFPNDDAVLKLLWLVAGNLGGKKTRPTAVRNWARIIQQLAIHFEGRVPLEIYANR
jgi:putative transposase